MSHQPLTDHASPVHTVAEAGSYIASVCFKHGPPRMTGIEIEWLLFDPHDPLRRPDAATLLAALGAYAPRTLNPDSPALALPAGGLVTVEPGGQLEISSAPSDRLVELISAMHEDIATLTAMLAPTGFELGEVAADPYRLPHRLLHTPRYDAMAAAFDQIGPAGRAMMCSTAATQVCIDLGAASGATARWRAAHQLGPVLLAAFANSARIAGGPALTGSHRMASWWQLDPERTMPPASLELADYVERTLDTQVLARSCDQGSWQVRSELTLRQWVQSDEPVTTADIDLHLSMLFPPVRPQGYLELRYLDAQPAGEWVAPLALIAALFADDQAVRSSSAICEPAADRWQTATELGLLDPMLSECAAELLVLAEPRITELGLPATVEIEVLRLLHRRLGAGISPAMEACEPAVTLEESR